MKPDGDIDETVVQNVSVESNIDEIGGEAMNAASLDKIDKNDKKRKYEVEKQIGLYFRYIGETSRSAYERGVEHKKDLEFRRTKSHLLRHCVEVHPDMHPDKVDFRIKFCLHISLLLKDKSERRWY